MINNKNFPILILGLLIGVGVNAGYGYIKEHKFFRGHSFEQKTHYFALPFTDMNVGHIGLSAIDQDTVFTIYRPITGEVIALVQVPKGKAESVRVNAGSYLIDYAVGKGKWYDREQMWGGNTQVVQTGIPITLVTLKRPNSKDEVKGGTLTINDPALRD